MGDDELRQDLAAWGNALTAASERATAVIPDIVGTLAHTWDDELGGGTVLVHGIDAAYPLTAMGYRRTTVAQLIDPGGGQHDLANVSDEHAFGAIGGWLPLDAGLDPLWEVERLSSDGPTDTPDDATDVLVDAAYASVDRFLVELVAAVNRVAAAKPAPSGRRLPWAPKRPPLVVLFTGDGVLVSREDADGWLPSGTDADARRHLGLD